MMIHHDQSGIPPDAWLLMCLSGVGSHVLGLFAFVPPILMDTTWLMAFVGLLGLVLRAWEGHRAHSRALLERDARILELARDLANIKDELGKNKVLLEFYKNSCRTESCPMYHLGPDRASG